MVVFSRTYITVHRNWTCGQENRGRVSFRYSLEENRKPAINAIAGSVSIHPLANQYRKIETIYSELDAITTYQPPPRSKYKKNNIYVAIAIACFLPKIDKIEIKLLIKKAKYTKKTMFCLKK
jgi:hypothetical protein